MITRELAKDIYHWITQKEFRLRPQAITAKHLSMRVRARDSDFAVLVKLRRNTSDISVFKQVFMQRAYALSDLDGLSAGYSTRFTNVYSGNPKPLILDLGANIGLTSLYFAKTYPRAQIIAVEPSADNFQCMLRNTSGHETIRPIQAAVACKSGRARIINPDAADWMHRTAIVDSDADDTVQAMSVFDLLALTDGVPFIAKIDIEGFEGNLFSENTEWVSRFPILIIELHDWMFPGQGKSMNFIRTISGRDRDLIIFKTENLLSVAF